MYSTKQSNVRQSKAKQRVRHGRWWANFWTLSHLLHLLFSVKCSWFISTIFVLNATHFNWLWSLIKFMEFKRTNERKRNEHAAQYTLDQYSVTERKCIFILQVAFILTLSVSPLSPSFVLPYSQKQRNFKDAFFYRKRHFIEFCDPFTISNLFLSLFRYL